MTQLLVRFEGGQNGSFAAQKVSRCPHYGLTCGGVGSNRVLVAVQQHMSSNSSKDIMWLNCCVGTNDRRNIRVDKHTDRDLYTQHHLWNPC